MNILLSYSGKNFFRHRTTISQLLRGRNKRQERQMYFGDYTVWTENVEDFII